MKAKKTRKYRITNLKTGGEFEKNTLPEACKVINAPYHTVKQSAAYTFDNGNYFEYNGFKIERVWIVSEK